MSIAITSTSRAIVKSVEEENQTVQLYGDLDIATAVGAMTQLRLALDGGEGLLIVDLRHLDFIDAAGLRVLVTAFRAAAQRGRSLELVNANPRVGRVFALVGLPGLIGVTRVGTTTD